MLEAARRPDRGALALGAALALLFSLSACGNAPRPAPADDSQSVAYDQAWQVATHNSYWVDRGNSNDLLASGVGERILDQLLADRVRGLEIDIHPDPARPGGFAVFHTVAGNSQCARLEDCLAMVRSFHRALPRHEVVTLVFELKGILAPTFDAAHTIDDFDRALVTELGDLLYRPSDLLARCARTTGSGSGSAASATLADCTARAGWPSVAELRGRVIATVLGNWDDLGDAQATRDWGTYATRDPIAARAAFPMASSWKLDWSALSPRLQQLVSQADLDAAFAQSAFLQIEDLADPRIDPFLARRGVIRVDNAFSTSDQEARIARGMQLLQTDYPWGQVDDRGLAEPLRPLPAVGSTAELREPGARLVLESSAPAEAARGAAVFAYRKLPAGQPTSWETTVAERAVAPGTGCLRAATGPGLGDDSIAVCRVKHRSFEDGALPPPASGAASAQDEPPQQVAESVDAALILCLSGTCVGARYPGDPAVLGGPGDLLSLAVAPHGSGSCATAAATDRVGADLAPAWVALGQPRCFDAPLSFQGIALTVDELGLAEGAVFAGTKLTARGKTGDVAAADFDGVVLFGAAGTTPAPEALVDATVDERR